MKHALYLPGPSYADPQVKQFAGWWAILERQRRAIARAGYFVETFEVDPALIDPASSLSRIASYSIAAAEHYQNTIYDLVVGAPSYAGHAILLARGECPTVTYGWNNADWWRDQMLVPEYAKFQAPYRTLPVNRIMNELSLLKSTRVIACSPFVQRTHAQVIGVGPSKVGLAPWGVDSRTFTPPDEPQPGFRILFVGGDPIRKGLTYLLDAWRAFERYAPEAELWIAGCDYRSADSRVRSFGMVPYEEMPALMRQCHVLVLPTLEDGIALAVQEAMASGLVPITTEDPADVFVDGVSGFQAPYRDSEEIFEYLKRLHDSPVLWATMSGAARMTAEGQTWDAFELAFAREIDVAEHVFAESTME